MTDADPPALSTPTDGSDLTAEEAADLEARLAAYRKKVSDQAQEAINAKYAPLRAFIATPEWTFVKEQLADLVKQYASDETVWVHLNPLNSISARLEAALPPLVAITV